MRSTTNLFPHPAPAPAGRHRAVSPMRVRRVAPDELIACAGCGARKKRPLEARLAGMVHPPFRDPQVVHRGDRLCVYCFVQLETFGQTRLESGVEKS